ncbi:MAG: hypothetical protein KDE27_22835 [Planctomycetes bacterium]|nr:hypothetical protein [Planctomycetota bacterium]
MSLVELASSLERSFDKSQDLLTRLVAGLRARRMAWVSAHPDGIAPAAELEQLAARLQTEDEVRRTLLADLAEVLPLPRGFARAVLHLNVTRIATAIPVPAARSLRRAADAATAVAKDVRRELALGRRLIGFAQRAHESVMADLARQAPQRGYDRTAQASRGLARVGASLVDGKV